jgi:hypothetical protein
MSYATKDFYSVLAIDKTTHLPFCTVLRGASRTQALEFAEDYELSGYDLSILIERGVTMPRENGNQNGNFLSQNA